MKSLQGKLTENVQKQRGRGMVSIFVLTFAKVVCSVLRADRVERINLSRSNSKRMIMLVEGVLSCWVSITSTGQSHWFTLLHFTPGTQ